MTLCWKKALSRFCRKMGWYKPMIYIDYKMVELRMLAEYSDYHKLLKQTDDDIHKQMGIALDTVKDKFV